MSNTTGVEPHNELDELLNGVDKTETKQEEVVQFEQPEPAKAEDESSEQSEKGEKTAQNNDADKDNVPPTPEPEKVPVAAIQAERRKRQELELQVAELKREQEPPRPDPFEDPDGAREYDQKINDDQLFEVRADLSIDMMKTSVGEENYQEAENAFLDAAQENPALAQAMRQSTNPAKFAYEEGRKHLFIKDVGSDPEAYKARIKSEIIAELKAENSAGSKQEEIAKKTDELPVSLAQEGGGAPPMSEVVSDSLERLLDS